VREEEGEGGRFQEGREDIHGRGIKGLKHDLQELLSVGLRVVRGLGHHDGVLLGGDSEFVVKSVMPKLKIL
jgi:hypothetical protein